MTDYSAEYLRGLNNEELEGTIAERDERIAHLNETLDDAYKARDRWATRAAAECARADDLASDLDRLRVLAARLCKAIIVSDENRIDADTTRAVVALRLAISPMGAIDHLVEKGEFNANYDGHGFVNPGKGSK